MTHQLFSDSALKAFENFLRIDKNTAHLRPKGAVDAVSPELRRALARDQQMTPFTRAMSSTRDGKRMGRDAGPIGERNLKELRKMLEEEEAKGDRASQSRIETLQFMIRMNEVRSDQAEWENPNDLIPPDDEEREAEEEGHEGEEVGENEDFPATAGRNVGGPARFRGMPERGGSMAGDEAYFARFADARRIGLDMPFGPTSSRSVYDSWGRRVDDGYVSRAEKRERKAQVMAMDAANVRSFESVFGEMTRHIKVLG